MMKNFILIFLIALIGCSTVKNVFVFKPYKKGIKAERQGNYVEAIKYYLQDIQKNPIETRSRLALADVFYTSTFIKMKNNTVTSSDIKNTIITNQIAYEIEKTEHRKDLLRRLYILLIEMYIENNNFDGAIDYIDRAKNIFTDHNNFDLLQAKIFSKQKQISEEQSLYKRLIEQSDKKNIEAVNNLVILYSNAEKYAEAEEVLLSQISKYPDDNTLNFLLGIIYIKTEEWNNAEKYLNNALKNRRDINLLINLAYVYLRQGEFDKALVQYENALGINPLNATVFFGIGNLYFVQNDFNKAIDYFKKAVLITPNDKNLLYNLGNSYLKNNNYNDAVTVFEKVLSIDPYDNLAYENIIYIYVEELNNKVMADYFLERYKGVNPEGYKRIIEFINK